MIVKQTIDILVSRHTSEFRRLTVIKYSVLYYTFFVYIYLFKKYLPLGIR